jgi:hypothetical protein
MKPLKDLSEDFSIGMVERAILSYLHENGEKEVSHIRYEIIRVDRFESPYANSTGTIFTAVVREQLFPLPQEHKEELTRWGVLLATFQEDGSFKISAPIMSAYLSSLT